MTKNLNLHWSAIRVGDVLDLGTIPMPVTVLEKDGPLLVLGAAGFKNFLHTCNDENLRVTQRFE